MAPLPESVSLDAAANLEPFTVAINTRRRLALDVGEWVVVLGQGPMGLGQTQLATLTGQRVIAVDTRPEALTMAKRYGADVIADAATEDVTDVVMCLTGGAGAAAVVETAGVAATVSQMPSLVRKYGQLAHVGISAGMGALDILAVMTKVLTVHGIGGNGGKGQYEAAIALTQAGRIDPSSLITHHFDLTDSARAFAVAHEKSEPVIKVVIHP